MWKNLMKYQNNTKSNTEVVRQCTILISDVYSLPQTLVLSSLCALHDLLDFSRYLGSC